jgi:hypothetical protein
MSHHGLAGNFLERLPQMINKKNKLAKQKEKPEAVSEIRLSKASRMAKKER